MTHIPSAIEVFYSYSHKDEDLRGDLENHLSILQANGVIKCWHDRQIGAGDEWEGEIDEHLDTAHIILLLISADFLASKYCRDVEMKRAIERHEAEEAIVIPIILRAVDNWQGTALGKLQALPKGARAVTSWRNRDEAFKNVAEGIRRKIETIAAPPGENPAPIVSFLFAKPRLDFLPYLCDRSDQEVELDAAIQRYKKDTEERSRPFICIVHGDEYECHDMFRKRLKETSLPKFLNLRKEQGSIEDYLLPWPSRKVSGKHPLDLCRRDLGDIILDNTEASIEDVLKGISQFKAPIMFYTDFGSRNWESDSRRRIEAFLEFWNALPDLPPRRYFICCLFFTYKRTDEMRFVNFFERRKFLKINEKAREFFTKELDFSKYRNLHAIVLPELSAVAQLDAENWIRDRRHFQGVCHMHYREFCKVQDSVEEIRTIYSSPSFRKFNGYIPMQPLAKELSRVLHKNRC